MSQLMAIINLTPDSFSGDGIAPDQALARFVAAVEAGAEYIDLGAESTRPGAQVLSDAEEWARLAPALQAITAHPLRKKIRLSVDSYHPATIRQALALGVDVINDVSGLRDAQMLTLAASHTGDVVAMHALTVPADKAVTLPKDADVIAEILRWRDVVLTRARAAGVDAQRLLFDPGIGFGKTPQQSFQIILRAGELVNSGGRWLFGHSRKSFLSLVTPAEGAARDEATALVSAFLSQSGVHVLRVHDVARHRVLLDGLCM